MINVTENRFTGLSSEDDNNEYNITNNIYTNINKKFILTFDSGCTDHTFHSIDHVKLNPNSKDKLVQSANGIFTKSIIGTNEIFGEVLLSSSCPENLVSMSKLVDTGWDIEYRKFPEDYFVIKKGEHCFRFTRNGGLYQYNEEEKDNGETTNAISLSNKSVNNTGKAQKLKWDLYVELHERLGHPSDEYLRQTIKSKSIVTDLTVEDINDAIQNIEPCEYCARAKMTKFSKKSSSQPRSTKVGEVLHMDILQYHKRSFLLAVEECTGFCFVIHIKSKDTDSLRNAINKIESRLYSINTKQENRRNKIKIIKCDLEGAISALEDELGFKNIRLFRTEAEGHDGMAEAFIKSIKKVARTIELSLQYKVSGDMIPDLMEYAAQCLNIMTNSHLNRPHNNESIITGTTPWFELTGEPIIASRLLRTQFGEVLIFHEPYSKSKGSHAARGEWGIVINRDINSSGVLKVKLIESGEIVSRKHFKRLGNQPPKRIMDIIHSWTTDGDTFSDIGDGYDEDFTIEDNNEDTTIQENINANTEILEHDIYQENTDSNSEKNLGVNITTGNVNADINSDDTTDSHTDIVPNVQANTDNAEITVNNQNISEAINVVNSDKLSMSQENTIATTISEHDDIAMVLMSFSEAKRNHPNDVDKVFNEELEQFLDKKVFYPVKFADLRGAYGDKQLPIINLIVLFTVKSNGNLKCRIVVNGKKQDISNYNPWEITASTASTQSIFTIIANAVENDIRLSTIDIKGAYLNAEIEKEVVIKFNQECSKRLVIMDPSLKEYLGFDGCLLCTLNKALYGLKESATLWQEHFTRSLGKTGYKSLATDPCILTADSTEKLTKANNIIGVYVDDALLAIKEEKEKKRVIKDLENNYGLLKKHEVNDDEVLPYRGLEIRQNIKKGIIDVSQSRYINQILTEDHPEINKSVPTPASDNLFEIDSKSRQLNEEEKKILLRDVSKLSWLSTQCRPDIKVAVSFLSTRVNNNPTIQDVNKTKRVLMYLYGTKDFPLRFRKSGNNQVNGYADASYMAHIDCKGHTGVIIKIGKNLIYTESKKQKLTAQSSTESEYLALNSAVNAIIRSREFMDEIGFKQGPSILRQDNMSTITAAYKPSTSSKLKHLRMREYHIKENLDNGTIKLIHCPTEDMVADILTKPLQGSQFTILRDALMGINDITERSQ